MMRIAKQICVVLSIAILWIGAVSGINIANASDIDEKMNIAVDSSAFRNIPWSYSMEETALAEEGRQRTRRVEVTKDVILYDMPISKLTYSFEDDVMVSRQFDFKSNKSTVFSSVFYSICLRYGFPLIAEKRHAMWQAGHLTITLRRGESLTCTYTLNIQAFAEAD